MFQPTVAIKSITQNTGILPINLGEAKLQRTTYTILHYYSLDPLLQEVADLQNQYNQLQVITKDKRHLQKELVNHNKLILHLQIIAVNKLHAIGYESIPTRIRRALFPDLGTLVKITTGNLDSTDEHRYNKILEDLNNNDKRLQKQIELQYSLTHEAIARFDNMIKNIEHSESAIQHKLSLLVNITDTAITVKDVFTAKDAATQLIFHYNTIITILQDLENALTFCKLRIYHPSILPLEDLKMQIEKIKLLRHLNIAPDDLNISEVQKLIKVDCTVEKNKILFFLSFPINYDTTFELYHLMPLPTTQNNTYVAIIPNNNYFLKSRNVVKTLNGPCVLGNPFYCSQTNVNINNNKCEQQVLLNGSTKQCEYVQLEVPENYLEFIPDINQYLGVFPCEDILRVESQDHDEVKEVQGVYLIEPALNNRILFRDHVLSFQEKASGKPIILHPEDNIISNVQVHSSLRLKNLQLATMDPNQIRKLMMENENNENWNFVNIILFVLILSFLIIQGVLKFYKKWTLKHPNDTSSNIVVGSSPTPNNIEVQPRVDSVYPKIPLPGAAKF